MNFQQRIYRLIFLLLLIAVSVTGQNRTTGSIKGKVRVETGSAAGVAVVVRQGEREVTRVMTNNKGEFTVSGLTPGMYGVTFRKPGLSVGSIENIEVRAGKTRSLGDRLILTIDEGTIAFVKGSVFTSAGRSLPGARVEIALIQSDGSLKKLGERISNEIGLFSFRLPPDAAKYRITVKMDGAQTATKDIEIDGASVYRVGISLQPATK